MLTRREFVAVTGGVLLAGPSLARVQAAELPRLLFIGLRGGFDGIGAVVPIGDPDYRVMRGSLAMHARDLLPLDGFFALHPAMQNFHLMFARGELAIHHAVGPQGVETRSHFEAWQSLSGFGWLPKQIHTPLAKVVTDAQGFESDMQKLASEWSRDGGPRISVVEFGGWDMHAGQGALTGLFADRLRALDRGIAHFRSAANRKNTLIIIASEFGRGVRVNASGGTDHGEGGVVFALGGMISGGNVRADWPGLKASALQEGGLRATRETHMVMGELFERYGLPRGTLV